MPHATGFGMGHNSSKQTQMPGMEDCMAQDMEKLPASLEVSKSSVGGDGDLSIGPGLTAKKRKDVMRGSSDECGSVTKRVLRSDSMKLRSDVEKACGVTVEVINNESFERNHCEAVVMIDGSGLLTVDTCNSEEDKELINVNVGNVLGESSRCSENNVEISGVAVIECAQGNGIGTQASFAELDGKRVNSDEKVSTVTHEEKNGCRDVISGSSVDEFQANKVSIEPSSGEVIDLSAIADDDKMSTDLLRRTSPTSGSESVEQEDAVVCTGGMVLHIGDHKVEKLPHIDDVHTETEDASIENGICTVDIHTNLTECVKQEEMGSPMDEITGVSPRDIVFTRRKSISRKTCEAKQAKCEEDVRFEKRVTRSATVKQREVSGSSYKTTTNKATLKSKGRVGDIVAHYTRKGGSTASPKDLHAGLVECNTSAKKQTVKTKVIDRKNSGVTGGDDHNIKVNEESENEITINLKSQPLTSNISTVEQTTKAAVLVVDQNISVSAITERNDTEHTDSDGVKSENKTPVPKSIMSVGAKIVASKKRILESVLDKSAGLSAVATPSMKKERNTSSDPEIGQTRSAGGKLTGNNCGSENKRVLRERQQCNQTNNLSRSSNYNKKLIHDQSDDDNTSSDSSYRRTRKRRSCGADSLVRQELEDTNDSEEVIPVKKNQKKGKHFERKQRAGSKLKHASGPSKAGRLGRSVLTKYESSSLSLQSGKGKVKVSEGKGKADEVSIIKSVTPSEKANTGSLREEKQKISEQIKAVLLDAGWTIDLRPRNGRDYMDSVYIPPSGKGSYWSVTKAYYVFQEGLKSEQKDSSKGQSLPKNSVGSPGKRQASSSSGCTLTEDILSKLKRMVVNKRTTKLELQKLRKKKHSLLKRFKKSKGKLKEKKNKITNWRKLHLSNERKKRGGCALLARGSNKESGSDTDGFVPYEWKRTVFSWLIDLDVLSVNTKLKCMDRSCSKVLLEGIVTRHGINCNCCSEVVSVLEFVVHAGGEVKELYRNILVEELDIDLLHCLINAWNKQSDSERQSFFPVSIEGDDPNDDACGICGDGGNLICCDGCPSTFHMTCLGLEALPSDDWCCANCSCKFCNEHSSDDVEDIVDDSSLRTCFQCKEKYHQACSAEIDCISISDRSGYLFCQQSCKLLFEDLQNLLAVKKDLDPEFSCRVVQRIHEDVPEIVHALDKRVECNSKIAIAMSLMDECFLPIVDQRTGINLIRNVVYSCGSNFVRLDFRGFYIFILERGDEIIAAASVRIHGTKLAEMPFIGTRNMYRRQGMCRRLLHGIEMILSSLNVEKLVIPAITELVDTWTSKFGFSPLEVCHKQEVKSISILVFPGTGLLQKPLLNKALPDEDPCSEGAGTVDSAHKPGEPSDVANKDSLRPIASGEPVGSGFTEYVDSGKNADGTCYGDVSQQSLHPDG